MENDGLTNISPIAFIFGVEEDDQVNKQQNPKYNSDQGVQILQEKHNSDVENEPNQSCMPGKILFQLVRLHANAYLKPGSEIRSTRDGDKETREISEPIAKGVSIMSSMLYHIP